MKYIKPFNENETYINFDEMYSIISEQLFYDLEDHFRYDKQQFFPIKIVLNKKNSGKYDLTIALGGGWVTRMSDEDIDYLNQLVNSMNDEYKKYNNFYAVFCGDGFGLGEKLVDIQNECFPKTSMDYMNFPPGRYPDRY